MQFTYFFSCLDLLTTDQIHLKVGRAINLVKRLDQWDKQCGSKEKEQVVRGWWPGTVDSDHAGNGGDSLMKVRINAGEKGSSCHRLERLIHLELADLVLFQPYLDPKFPNVVPRAKSTSPNGNAGGPNAKRKCQECVLCSYTTCFSVS
jgi:dUTPase